MANEVDKRELVGVSAHLGRVAPLFDASQQVELFDLSGDGAVPAGVIPLAGVPAPHRPSVLRGRGVGTLICGAISGYAASQLAAGGVRVISWVCGPVEAVLGAYRSGLLAEPSWRMPGWRGRRAGRCRRGGPGRGPGGPPGPRFWKS